MEQIIWNITDNTVASDSTQINFKNEWLADLNSIIGTNIKRKSDLINHLNNKDIEFDDFITKNKIKIIISSDNKQAQIRLFKNDKRFFLRELQNNSFTVKYQYNDTIYWIMLVIGDEKYISYKKKDSPQHDWNNISNGYSKKAKENLKPKLESYSMMNLLNLFNTKSILHISYYQREYNISPENAYQLIKDTLINDNEVGGVISIINTKKNNIDEIVDIFDGQQRITTFILFMFSLKVHCQNHFNKEFKESNISDIFTSIPKIEFEEDIRTSFYTRLFELKNLEGLFNVANEFKFSHPNELEFILLSLNNLMKENGENISNIFLNIKTENKIKVLTYDSQNKNIANKLFDIYNSPSTPVDSYERLENYIISKLNNDKRENYIKKLTLLKKGFYDSQTSKNKLNKFLGFSTLYYIYIYSEDLQKAIQNIVDKNAIHKNFGYIKEKQPFDEHILYELIKLLEVENNNITSLFDFTLGSNSKLFDMVSNIILTIMSSNKTIYWDTNIINPSFSFKNIGLTDFHKKIITEAITTLNKVSNFGLNNYIEKYILFYVIFGNNIKNEEINWIYIEKYLYTIFDNKVNEQNKHIKEKNLGIKIISKTNFDQFKTNYIKTKKNKLPKLLQEENSLAERKKILWNELTGYIKNSYKYVPKFSHNEHRIHAALFFNQTNSDINLEVEHLICQKTLKDDIAKKNSLSNLWMCTRPTHKDLHNDKISISKENFETWEEKYTNDKFRIEKVSKVNRFKYHLFFKELNYFYYLLFNKEIDMKSMIYKIFEEKIINIEATINIWISEFNTSSADDEIQLENISFKNDSFDDFINKLAQSSHSIPGASFPGGYTLTEDQINLVQLLINDFDNVNEINYI